MGKITVDQVINVIEKAKILKDASNLQVDVPLTDQGMDSLDFAGIFFNLEEEFNVKFPDEDIDALQTLESIVTYVNDRI